jgi:RNA polymerase sigma factor (TIGR02999 family)
MTQTETLTELLLDWRSGNKAAFDKLVPLAYGELRRLAHHYMRRQRAGHSLETAALINEAYLRLLDYKDMRWQNRPHFFAVAAQAMRRILVDHARRRDYLKRGGGAVKVSLDAAAVVGDERAAELVALDDALNELAKFDPRKSQIVELRYFGGLSVEETADVIGVSPVTVMRDWRASKGWLLKAMQAEQRLPDRVSQPVS